MARWVFLIGLVGLMMACAGSSKKNPPVSEFEGIRYLSVLCSKDRKVRSLVINSNVKVLCKKPLRNKDK